MNNDGRPGPYGRPVSAPDVRVRPGRPCPGQYVSVRGHGFERFLFGIRYSLVELVSNPFSHQSTPSIIRSRNHMKIFSYFFIRNHLSYEISDRNRSSISVQGGLTSHWWSLTMYL